MPFAATWMDLQIIILIEVRDKYHMLSPIHGILKNDRNELIYKAETDSQTQKTNLWFSKGKGWGGMINSESGLTYIHHYI